jgi:hypothetical protein
MAVAMIYGRLNDDKVFGEFNGRFDWVDCSMPETVIDQCKLLHLDDSPAQSQCGSHGFNQQSCVKAILQMKNLSSSQQAVESFGKLRRSDILLHQTIKGAPCDDDCYAPAQAGIAGFYKERSAGVVDARQHENQDLVFVQLSYNDQAMFGDLCVINHGSYFKLE